MLAPNITAFYAASMACTAPAADFVAALSAETAGARTMVPMAPTPKVH
jgi:hypothetical protein